MGYATNDTRWEGRDQGTLASGFQTGGKELELLEGRGSLLPADWVKWREAQSLIY